MRQWSCLLVTLISLHVTFINKIITRFYGPMISEKMEYNAKDGSNIKNNSIRSRHISKLHERVQTKYSEMQKKIEKAKSIDCLSSIQEQDIFVNKTPTPMNKSLHREVAGQDKTRQTIIVDCTKENDATSLNVEYENAIISGHNVPIVDLLSIEDNNQKTENEFLYELPFKGSLESLTDVVKDSDDSIEAISPAPKSIRSRIRLRIHEARKRRQDQKLDNKQKNSLNNMEKMILSNTTKIHKKNKIATVAIGLIEATGFVILEDEKPRYIGCRIRLGSEKRKSKMIKSYDPTVKFQELHTFNLYDDDYVLDIAVWDKDFKIGSHTVDLSIIKREKTHNIQIQLDNSEVKLTLLLTISGITMSDISTWRGINDKELEKENETMLRKYEWYRFRNITNVGWLNVIVYGAKGLNGTDCYCILKINNERLYTATDYKTHAPVWIKTFSFDIADITSILEITVYDEKRAEDVGNISIPLLNIQSGRKWYALKENTRRERAKGNNPRILLEMKVVWNLINGSIRVINPKEVDLMRTEKKLDRHLLARNIARGKVVMMWVVNAFRILKSCFEWESKKANFVSLICWLLFCFYFKSWMLPLLLLIPFYIYRPHVKKQLSTTTENYHKEDKSLRRRINDFQETIQTIQNFVGKVASLGESIKNLYNFSSPFVSFLAIFLITAIAFIIYFLPLQYVLMVWGVHKFTRKILRPNRIPHSEILDLLSRIPDDETLLDCLEIPLEPITDDDEF